MRKIISATAAASLVCSSPAIAWGYEGHEIIATIARADLTPAVRAKVDAILATDPDTLTGPDMVSRATWADAWRSAGHRETAQWHFVDQELDGPDLKSACFGFPTADDPASAGPATDCVVDKIQEFTAELASPTTTTAERLLALKYVLHFVGDVHQPLHASDNHDRGGNCVLITISGSRSANLHAYWDTGVVEAAMGMDVDAAAMLLRSSVTAGQQRLWQQGNPTAWAKESFQVARTVAYTIGSPAGCASNVAPITFPAGYEAAAQSAARVQLQRAGVRLAMVLNTALARVPIAASLDSTVASTAIPQERTHATTKTTGRNSASLACSADASQKGLHGKERQRFLRTCTRAAAATQ